MSNHPFSQQYARTLRLSRTKLDHIILLGILPPTSRILDAPLTMNPQKNTMHSMTKWSLSARLVRNHPKPFLKLIRTTILNYIYFTLLFIKNCSQLSNTRILKRRAFDWLIISNSCWHTFTLFISKAESKHPTKERASDDAVRWGPHKPWDCFGSNTFARYLSFNPIGEEYWY